MFRRSSHVGMQLTSALRTHRIAGCPGVPTIIARYSPPSHIHMTTTTCSSFRFASTGDNNTGAAFVSSIKATDADGGSESHTHTTDAQHKTDSSASNHRSSSSSEADKKERAAQFEPGVHMDETMGEGNLRHYNPWEVLGLPAGASAHVVRLKYHDLLQECHPEYVKHGKSADIIRLNQINKAYEIITRSPTLDKKYRNLVSDSQKIYYRVLPEWMAKNVDEMPRYVSWVRWRAPTLLQLFLVGFGCYATGRMYVDFPVFTTVFLTCLIFDFLFHTMSAPFALSLLFLNALLTRKTYSMAWLLSPRELLQGPLSY